MASGAQTVLVVEDEASIASFVSLYLKNAGYDVRAVTTGNAALAQVAAELPALIILDLMLPDLDGIEIAGSGRLRHVLPMPTARDEDVDKIRLEVGADDYLTKPNPRSCRAVKSVPRRLRRSAGTSGRLPTTVTSRSTRAAAKSRSAREIRRRRSSTCSELLDRLGLVLTRDQLLERVWGYTFAGDAVDACTSGSCARPRGPADRDRLGCRLQGRPERAPRPRRRPCSTPCAARRRSSWRGSHLRAVTSPIALRLPGPLATPPGTSCAERLRGSAAVRRVGGAGGRRGEGRTHLAASKLEAATGDRLYFVGASISPGRTLV
jgi:two-component system response regulator VicR